MEQDSHNWIWQICAYIFKLMYSAKPSSTPLNIEASKLYESAQNLFRIKVEESIRTAVLCSARSFMACLGKSITRLFDVMYTG